MIFFLYISLLILLPIPVNAIQLSYINNAILQPAYNANYVLISDITCDQCLCIYSLSSLVINCFTNNSCQLFSIFPLTYQIKVTPGARIYSSQRLFPNPSQCCMPNISYLLNKLRMATQISASVANPREIIIDNHGYITTIEMKSNHLDRFNPTNLTSISQTIISMNSSRSIAYNNGAFFVAPNNNISMMIIDSGNLTILSNVLLTSVDGPRGMMFLNDGQTMVVSSINNNYLVFFNRTAVSPIKYVFTSYQLINCSGPHGMWRVNDSFFYVTSYKNNSIYSYTRVNSVWQENYVFTTPKFNNITGTTHITIDECQRAWISSETDTTLIYDQQGNLLGDLTINNAKIFDINVVNNYVVYISDSNLNRTIRLDPGIQCQL